MAHDSTYQVFKGEVLSRTKVKNNILRIWNLTDETERYDWYANANKLAEIMANNNDTTKAKAVGVIAALSPLKTWEQNLKIARDFLLTGTAGHMGQFVNKAIQIVNSDGSDETILDILRGRKISAFYLNILYPNKANNVTIDRHALSVALGYWVSDEDYAGMTAGQYQFFVQCYILAAMKADTTPLTMQSATWVKWRKIKKDYAK